MVLGKMFKMFKMFVRTQIIVLNFTDCDHLFVELIACNSQYFDIISPKF